MLNLLVFHSHNQCKVQVIPPLWSKDRTVAAAAQIAIDRIKLPQLWYSIV